MKFTIVVKKLCKILVYLLVFLLVILLAAELIINTNYAKNSIKKKVITYLQRKLKTTVSINSIDYSLLNSIEIHAIYLEDQHKDTLLAAQKLAVQIDVFKLISGEICINNIDLQNCSINIKRAEVDSNFNYQFILNAFATNKSPTKPIDTSRINLIIKNIVLNNIHLNYLDKYAGTDIEVGIGKAETSIKNFNIENLQFNIDKLKTDNVTFLMNIYKNQKPNDNTKTKNSNLQLSINQILLNNTTGKIVNKINGMYYANSISNLNIKSALVNLTSQKIAVDKIELDRSFIKFISSKSTLVIDSSSTSMPWYVVLKNINLKNDSVQFDNNNIAAAKEGLDFNHLKMNQINIEANNIYYSLDSILANINQLSFKDKSGFNIDTTHATILYTNKQIVANNLFIKTPQSILHSSLNISCANFKNIMVDTKSTIVVAKFNNSLIAINDLYLIMPSLKKTLSPQKFANNFIQFNTIINGNLAKLNIPFLQCSGLAGSVLNGKAVLYNIADTNKLAYDIDIFNSVIQQRDILKFIPKKNNFSVDKIPTLFKLNTKIKGTLKNIDAIININSKPFTWIGSASVKNINNTKNIAYDLIIKDSRIDRNFIATFIPNQSLPTQISLPNTFLLRGKAKGNMNNINTDLLLDGDYGAVSINGFVYNFRNAEDANYDFHFSTKNFALGKFIKQDTLFENVTLSGTAKGTGFNYKTMHAVANTAINSIGFKQYNYKNLIFEANLNAGNLKSIGGVNDSNIQLHYAVAANVSGKFPLGNATINVDTIQFKKLNIFPDILNASFKINVKARSLNPENMDVLIAIDSSKITLHNNKYFLDTIIAKANKINNITTINLKSPLMDFNAKGNFEYDKLIPSIEQYLNKYYKINDDAIKYYANQQLQFNGEIKQTPLVSDLLPDFVYNNIKFKGSYASQDADSALNFYADIPYFLYKNYKISKGKLNISSINNQIKATANADTLLVGSNVFYGAMVNVNAAKDSINIDVVTKDNIMKERYAIGAIVANKSNSYTIQLKDNLLLNYQKWNVTDDNKIEYSPNGILIKNFLLNYKSQQVKLASKEAVLNSPIDVNIDSFNIKNITSFFNTDTLLATGFLKAHFTINDFEKKIPSFVGVINVDDFKYLQQPVGNINIVATKINDNNINTIIDLTKYGNDVNINANYYQNNIDKQFDAKVDIRQLRMVTIQAFTNGNIEGASGNITGNVALNGTFAQPSWTGLISFDTTKFTLAKLGTTYTINKQKIDLGTRDISFDNFTIKDLINNSLVLDGNITVNTFSDYNLDLNLVAKQFTIVNTPKTIYNQLYGFAAINADIDISGTAASPTIEGDLEVTNKSNVTLVLPQNNVNKDAAKSIVRFINRDTFNLPEKKPFAIVLDKKSNFAQFLNYNLNVSIPKNASLTFILDPTTSDELNVKGEAKLNAGVDPGGNIVLAGNYDLDNGHYILHYQFLTRQFDLLSGSTIAFSGEPTDADINITAQYIVNTSAIDLLSNEVSNVDPQTANTFNQKIPFKILLYLKGTIKKPEISFDIQLVDDNNTVMSNELKSVLDNKLVQLRGDIAGINKEVFSLLLLGRFVGEQSSDFFSSSGSGGGLDESARESVSKFLSSALDHIASDLVKGVDINLNLNSYNDYTSGDAQQRTDLGVSVSKSFLNDRLTLSVGESFGLENQNAGAKAQQEQGASYLPDVTANFKLTKDGKYALKAYRKTQFEVILDGYVVESGLAFVFKMDYDKFKELFENKKVINK